MLRGNKGEWSEVYVFLRLLGEGRLYSADEKLNKDDKTFYNIVHIERTERGIRTEFRRAPDKESIEIKRDGMLLRQEALVIERAAFSAEAMRLYEDIKKAGKGSFEVKRTEEFLERIGVYSLKARSSDKADIRIKIHDINSGFETVQGFSIKSRLGSPSTLINAGKTTNIIYSVEGGVDEEISSLFNSMEKATFRERFSYLRRAGAELRYKDFSKRTFKNNLILIDSALPEIIAELVKAYYVEGEFRTEDAVTRISSENPLCYDMGEGHEFYKYKYKKLLTECALGMLPSKIWTGRADATGGYIIVREDGEALCYHLFNRNEFENYLFDNTRFDTSSTSKHDFGYIYKENGKYYIRLNMQVRFIK